MGIISAIKFILSQYNKIVDRDSAFYPQRKKTFDVLEYMFERNYNFEDNSIFSDLKTLIKSDGTKKFLKEAKNIFCPRIYNKIRKLVCIIENAIEESDPFDKVTSKRSEKEFIYYIKDLKVLIYNHPEFKFYKKEFIKERDILRHNRICGIFSYLWDYKIEPLFLKIKSKLSQ